MTPRTAALLAFAVTLVACGDDGSPDVLPDAPPAPPPFTLSVSPDRVPVLTGTSATVEVSVERAPGFTGAVAITEAGMPAGVSVTEATIAEDATKVMLTVTADAGAAHSLPTPVAIRGTSAGTVDDVDLTVTVYGPPGSLDTTFGRQMLPAGDSDDYAYGAAVDAEGRLVIAGRTSERNGDFALMRLTRDGALDSSFGTGGKVTTDLAGGADSIHAIAIQPDGAIVVAGSSGTDIAVARYLPSGALDTSFATTGWRTLSLGPDTDAAFAIALQADGKIVVGGHTSRPVTGLDFALARFTASGDLDTTFDNDGFVVTSIASNGGRDSIYALAIDSAGRIVAAGGEGDFTIARYSPTGALDTTFDLDGIVAGVFESIIGAARAVALDANGRIVVAGHAGHDVALIRLTSSGMPDDRFGTFGKVVTPMSFENWDEAHGIAIEADGHIVVGGWVYEGLGSSGNFMLARYTTTGTLDPTFDTDGVVITPVAAGTKPDQGTALVLQPDPRIPHTRVVVAGYASDSNSDFAVTRYWR